MRHKIENLIETAETQKEKRRLAFTKIQFFCLGVSGASLVGTFDVWWKSGHVAALFFTLAVILGLCKVASCRRTRMMYSAKPIALPLNRRVS